MKNLFPQYMKQTYFKKTLHIHTKITSEISSFLFRKSVKIGC